MTRSVLGEWGEAAAHKCLEGHGYRIRPGNWRCAEGEIDLVAETSRAPVLVEVKTRRGEAFGAPQDAVGSGKAKHLVHAAARYLEEQQLEDAAWRVDVIAITARPGPQDLRLDDIRDEVEGHIP